MKKQITCLLLLLSCIQLNGQTKLRWGIHFAPTISKNLLWDVAQDTPVGSFQPVFSYAFGALADFCFSPEWTLQSGLIMDAWRSRHFVDIPVNTPDTAHDVEFTQTIQTRYSVQIPFALLFMHGKGPLRLVAKAGMNVSYTFGRSLRLYNKFNSADPWVLAGQSGFDRGNFRPRQYFCLEAAAGIDWKFAERKYLRVMPFFSWQIFSYRRTLTSIKGNHWNAGLQIQLLFGN